ncbi:MAG: hypothetical protein ACI9JN_000642 [Bacteroidia bacterium]|jgi:hypothetical protein
MKKLLTLVFILPLFTIGCGGDDTPEPPTTSKLKKELLYDKDWTDESQTIGHTFNSDGTYATIGTWEWVNDSDTIKVHENPTNKDFIWVINKGNTATKMEAKLSTSTSFGEFRTSW